MTGYFLIYRGLHDHPLFKSNAAYSKFEAWVDLIEQANFADSFFRHKSQIHLIARGCIGTSYRSLARHWHWSVDRVIRELTLWKTQGMIELETRHGYVHITICNYADYQKPCDTDTTLTRQRRDTDATLTSTNQKKEKKVNKEKNITPISPLPDWLPVELWQAYLEMRRRKKATPTDKAVVILIAKLDSWRAKGHDPSEILSKSITCNWTDIYEPKGNQHENAIRNANTPTTTADRSGPVIGQSKWTTAAEQLIAEDRATGRWKDRI